VGLGAGGPAGPATVDPHRGNAPALRLYERLGFRPDPDGSTAEGHVVLAVTAAAWAARAR
jgi:RimJ/RimL family protein N-acetyltransferase